MASLADLFNPTFLMFLGILVLVVALLVVYFESKMRDQNHKIASMLSLVSTLAEDVTGVKMALNSVLAIRGGQMFQQPTIPSEENLGNSQQNKLIEVSDDEESDDEDNDNLENEDLENEDLENEDLESVEDDSSEDTNNDIKVVKLQLSNEVIQDNDSYEEANNLDLDVAEDLDLDVAEDLPEIGDDYVEEMLSLKYDENHEDTNNLDESVIPFSGDLKTISINLGEEQQQSEVNIDYKKLQLAKLRSVVIEKGLTSSSEAQKLKKPELLKLLGAE
jgi:hypothetical protein